jgi:hypothetical protein
MASVFWPFSPDGNTVAGRFGSRAVMTSRMRSTVSWLTASFPARSSIRPRSPAYRRSGASLSAMLRALSPISSSFVYTENDILTF